MKSRDVELFHIAHLPRLLVAGNRSTLKRYAIKATTEDFNEDNHENMGRRSPDGCYRFNQWRIRSSASAGSIAREGPRAGQGAAD
jgi:hypothetical protein